MNASTADLAQVFGIFIGLAPIIVGLVQALRKAGLTSPWAPITSVGLGIGLALICATFITGLSWGAVILGGIVAGLSASGLYSGGKTILAVSNTP